MKAQWNYASIATVGPSIIALALFCILASGCGRKDESASTQPSAPTAQIQPSTPSLLRVSVDLASERSAFKTHLLRHGPPPGDQPPYAPLDGDGAIYARYRSGELRLDAWLSKDPRDGKRHPAIVYLHGNFVFEPRHWVSTQPYRDAGMIAMTPMMRGENGNSGDFEMFYSEVDDVIAAGNYLAALPYVDPKRVYLAGHSVGGTLVMLVAEMPSPFAAAAAFSGSPDLETFMSDENKAICPFDLSNPQECRLRSAFPFVSSLKCPLYLFDGSQEDWAIPRTKQFEAAAKAAGKSCQWQTVPGDHGTSKPRAIVASIPLLLAHQKAE
jgi:dipeptidyl aminopeptidase/acylaminoacyl peptidase